MPRNLRKVFNVACRATGFVLLLVPIFLLMGWSEAKQEVLTKTWLYLGSLVVICYIIYGYISLAWFLATSHKFK